eukprot:CAMPEP_0114152466 /NCGR_PEP_ID=MMETSP0043_2-20121206/23816_1 /TAXON_ID=464988 /ORGANISM="Hemiselmis andersenii, Strain CCMP644" /LENGTH=62 /DNA_ID=CAMNT_0001247395 /DNA_START=308 /DNA_END=496 /DNA_ORIENTATION=+
MTIAATTTKPTTTHTAMTRRGSITVKPEDGAGVVERRGDGDGAAATATGVELGVTDVLFVAF